MTLSNRLVGEELDVDDGRAIGVEILGDGFNGAHTEVASIENDLEGVGFQASKSSSEKIREMNSPSVDVLDDVS